MGDQERAAACVSGEEALSSMSVLPGAKESVMRTTLALREVCEEYVDIFFGIETLHLDIFFLRGVEVNIKQASLH